jgi:hypothetical protein
VVVEITSGISGLEKKERGVRSDNLNIATGDTMRKQGKGGGVWVEETGSNNDLLKRGG